MLPPPGGIASVGNSVVSVTIALSPLPDRNIDQCGQRPGSRLQGAGAQAGYCPSPGLSIWPPPVSSPRIIGTWGHSKYFISLLALPPPAVISFIPLSLYWSQFSSVKTEYRPVPVLQLSVYHSMIPFHWDWSLNRISLSDPSFLPWIWGGK